jgi:signal transduction histidine kinase
MRKVLAYLSTLLKPSLRYKVALVFVLPIFVLVLFLSYNHYVNERALVKEQIKLTAAQLGDVVLGSLGQSMLMNDRTMISESLKDIGKQGNFKRVWIINQNGEVRESNAPGDIGLKLDTSMTGCAECHQKPLAARTDVIDMSQETGLLRIATPINNDVPCQKCHLAGQKYLGMLVLDVSTAAIEANMLNDLRGNLLLTFLAALVGMAAALALVNWLIIRRVEVLHKAMVAFQNGDSSARVEKKWRSEDELTQLADSFNDLADTVVRHENELKESARARLQAISDERDRLARELHDGVAQFIGYVNAKTMAVRLLIQKGRFEEAEQQLAQIEQVVQDQSIDVRASIIGLKMASESGSGLATGLRQFIEQCNRLSDIPIQADIDPESEIIRLDAEKEQQLLRVVQEALSNVRKHASAKQATVRLAVQADELVMSIHDDGVGFNPARWNEDDHAHFGLRTMRERMDMIGAALVIESEPGQGTTITVRVKAKES